MISILDFIASNLKSVLVIFLVGTLLAYKKVKIGGVSKTNREKSAGYMPKKTQKTTYQVEKEGTPKKRKVE